MEKIVHTGLDLKNIWILCPCDKTETWVYMYANDFKIPIKEIKSSSWFIDEDNIVLDNLSEMLQNNFNNNNKKIKKFKIKKIENKQSMYIIPNDRIPLLSKKYDTDETDIEEYEKHKKILVKRKPLKWMNTKNWYHRNK